MLAKQNPGLESFGKRDRLGEVRKVGQIDRYVVSRCLRNSSDKLHSKN